MEKKVCKYNAYKACDTHSDNWKEQQELCDGCPNNIEADPPSPEMVCPKSTLCKYYTGENRCYWGIFVDDVKCNGNINRSDLFMCLNYSSPEPPEKVSIGTIPYLKEFREIIIKIQDETAQAQILKLQQAGWGSNSELRDECARWEMLVNTKEAKIKELQKRLEKYE